MGMGRLRVLKKAAPQEHKQVKVKAREKPVAVLLLRREVQLLALQANKVVGETRMAPQLRLVILALKVNPLKKMFKN